MDSPDNDREMRRELDDVTHGRIQDFQEGVLTPKGAPTY